MRVKQTLSLLLALLITGSICLSGCGGGKTETASETDTAVQPETVKEDRWLDDLPDQMDLDGRTMRFLVQTAENASNEVLVEDMNGEVINDAVFTRNSNLEERLNASMSQELITSGGFDTATRQLTELVLAGSDDFDLFCSNSFTTVLLAVDGILTELTQLQYLDLTKEYWAQGFNETASIAGKQYICTGPMALGFYRYLMVGMFNKSMFERYNVEYPYDTVLAGGWTLDVQNELAEKFYVDTNGDGARDAGDTYGFYTRANTDTSINDGYWASVNLRTISKDENGYYKYDVNLEDFVNGIDKLLVLMNGSGSYSKAENIVNVVYDEGVYGKFVEGGTAMINAHMNMVESAFLRSMEDDYGVLPLPKTDENQEEYCSLAQDQFLVYAIPASVNPGGLEDIGMFLEAYASESFNVVRPAYYETALTAKYMNDPESAAMLDMIADSMYIDPAILYMNYFNLNVGTLRNILGQGQNTIASQIASVEQAMITAVEKLNAAYSDN